MQKGFKDLAVFSLKGNDNRIHFWYVSKKEAINLLKCADLRRKFQTLLNINFLYHTSKGNKEVIAFDDNEIATGNFTLNNQSFWKDVDFHNVLISNIIFFLVRKFINSLLVT